MVKWFPSLSLISSAKEPAADAEAGGERVGQESARRSAQTRAMERGKRVATLLSPLYRQGKIDSHYLPLVTKAVKGLAVQNALHTAGVTYEE
jgi:hypothetical protein